MQASIEKFRGRSAAYGSRHLWEGQSAWSRLPRCRFDWLLSWCCSRFLLLWFLLVLFCRSLQIKRPQWAGREPSTYRCSRCSLTFLLLLFLVLEVREGDETRHIEHTCMVRASLTGAWRTPPAAVKSAFAFSRAATCKHVALCTVSSLANASPPHRQLPCPHHQL